MNTGCQQIDRILKFAEKEGNLIKEVSRWTKINKVIHMSNPLSIHLRSKIEREIKGLVYSKPDPTPFDKAHESFGCIECSVAIEFPVVQKN